MGIFTLAIPTNVRYNSLATGTKQTSMSPESVQAYTARRIPAFPAQGIDVGGLCMQTHQARKAPGSPAKCGVGLLCSDFILTPYSPACQLQISHFVR